MLTRCKMFPQTSPRWGKGQPLYTPRRPTLVNAGDTPMVMWRCGRSEIAANSNVVHFFVKFKRWTSAVVNSHACCDGGLCSCSYEYNYDNIIGIREC